MKKISFWVLTVIILSCTTTKQSSSHLKGDQLIIARKYIGNFIEYYHTDPQVVAGIDLIWIKTTVYTTYGKISAYGKTCKFSVGDKIYLRPIYSTPGNYGNWAYQIENDSAVNYRVSEFRFENNVLMRTRSL